MASKVKPGPRMASIMHALNHSATGEWSATIKPEDCALLLVVLADYYARLKAGA